MRRAGGKKIPRRIQTYGEEIFCRSPSRSLILKEARMLGLIGFDERLSFADQVEGVWNLVNTPHKTLIAKNVIAMFKNAFRAPAFAPVFA